MEVSAFAAYQEAAKNVPKNKSPKEKSQQKKSPKEKSPKDKKQKNENNRPEFVLPKAPKVAKKVGAKKDFVFIFSKQITRIIS